jgi:hypothetical protein
VEKLYTHQEVIVKEIAWVSSIRAYAPHAGSQMDNYVGSDTLEKALDCLEVTQIEIFAARNVQVNCASTF